MTALRAGLLDELSRINRRLAESTWCPVQREALECRRQDLAGLVRQLGRQPSAVLLARLG